MKKTKKTVLAALLSAIALVMQIIGNVITSLDLSAAALSGMIGMMIRAEMGIMYSILSYITVSVLSILLFPNKLIAIFYICFFGLYPIFKQDIDRLGKYLSWIIKILAFNIIFSGIIFLGTSVLTIDDPIFSFSVISYLLGNTSFVLYDIAISMIYRLYMTRYRNIFFKNNSKRK
ncbi:MAG: hypothetical protein A2Y17_05765 [Clostridiales bacterium GWF2_38_85]|nr:MAG: hypothetical protein A2Y17_05765 [Clostridiales bacterium GWF2_38_85]HBL84011.1 hypothetical protein [Clostridiales bacterium]